MWLTPTLSFGRPRDDSYSELLHELRSKTCNLKNTDQDLDKGLSSKMLSAQAYRHDIKIVGQDIMVLQIHKFHHKEGVRQADS